MAISKKGWLGVARETTPGTLVAVPTLYTPTKSTFKNETKYIYLDEERGTRDGNYGRVPTNQMANLTTKGGYYNDSSVYFLLAWLGGIVSSQPSIGSAPTVWSHALSLADVPPSLTLTRSADAATYQFGYSAVSKVGLTFAGENKLLEIDASLLSAYGVKLASPPTPTFSTLLPFPGYSPTITIGGASSLDVAEMTITLDQKVSPFNPADGTPGFATLYYGERTAKLSFTVRFDNDTFYNKFFNSPNVDDHITIVFNGPLIASTYHQSLTLDFPIVGYDTMDHDFSKDNVLLKVTATARPGATANSLMTATVQNTVTGYAS